jgi:hypothetical protein
MAGSAVGVGDLVIDLCSCSLGIRPMRASVKLRTSSRSWSLSSPMAASRRMEIRVVDRRQPVRCRSRRCTCPPETPPNGENAWDLIHRSGDIRGSGPPVRNRRDLFPAFRQTHPFLILLTCRP